MFTRDDLRNVLCWYTGDGGQRDLIVARARQDGPLTVGTHEWQKEVDALVAEGLLEQTSRSVDAYSIHAPLMVEKVTVAWLTLTPKGRRS